MNCLPAQPAHIILWAHVTLPPLTVSHCKQTATSHPPCPMLLAAQALIVKIELPGVSAAADVQLDVSEDTVSLEVPGKYRLHLALRCKVDNQQGTAKFHISKHQMTLTLPVIQAVQQQALQEQKQCVQQHDRPAGTPGGQRRQPHSAQQPQAQLTSRHEGAQPADPVEQASRVQAPAHKAESLQPGAVDTPPHADEAPALQPQDSSQASSSPVAGKTQNQLKWEELHKQKTLQGEGCQQHSNGSKQVADDGQEQAMGEQQQQQLAKACAVEPPPAVRPRLSGRRVRTSDFV